MHQDLNLFEVLKCSSEEVTSTILSELSWDILVMQYNYNSAKNSNHVVHPEDRILKKLGYVTNDKAASILRDLISSTVEVID